MKQYIYEINAFIHKADEEGFEVIEEKIKARTEKEAKWKLGRRYPGAFNIGKKRHSQVCVA